jgi:hypothetical protein
MTVSSPLELELQFTNVNNNSSFRMPVEPSTTVSDIIHSPQMERFFGETLQLPYCSNAITVLHNGTPCQSTETVQSLALTHGSLLYCEYNSALEYIESYPTVCAPEELQQRLRVIVQDTRDHINVQPSPKELPPVHPSAASLPHFDADLTLNITHASLIEINRMYW